jgi:hypothetical protein
MRGRAATPDGYGALIEFAQKMEQGLTIGLGEGEIAEFG